LQFNQAGLALLQHSESCCLTAYQDQAGVWTIGYGHTGPGVGHGTVWTKPQAEAALQRDVAQFAAGVAGLVTNQTLTGNQFSALVVFAYNVGLPGFTTSSVLREVNTGSLEGVPPAMLMWDHITNPHTGHLEVSQGLVNRRKMEIALWNTPDVLA
jgi:lysozyme